ncbi:DUF2219 family protein, partial [bacterium]|nr:DUF2219 family protein [bacterium]
NPKDRLKEVICSKDWSANLYMGAQGRYVFNNNRIDSTSYDVESKKYVYDLKGGGVIRYKEVYLQMGLVRTSSDWKSDAYNTEGSAHTYGSLSVTLPFSGFGDLGNKLFSPIKWITDKDYRDGFAEQRRFKEQIRNHGITIVLDPNDKNNTVNIKCD